MIERQAPRRDLAWALGLFLLALVPRLVHIVTVRDSPFFSLLYIDPLMYDEWGRRIAAGRLFSERPFFLDPLYPYFLGGVFAVFGHRFEPVVLIQQGLGALVPPVLFLAALRWFDRPAALAAGVMAALYLPSIYFGGLIMKPGLSLVLVTLALALLSRALAGSGPATWCIAGVVFGLACLTRGNLILTLPVLASWMLLRSAAGDQPGDWRARLAGRLRAQSRWAEAAGFSLGAALVLALPAAHNYAVGGELILSTANAGANFYIGNNPDNSTGEYQQLPFINANPKYEQRDFAREARRRSSRTTMTDREISAFWFGESLRWIRSEPGAWLRLMWRKVRSFWGAYEIPDSLDYYLYSEYAPVLRLPLPGFGLVAPLGLLGAALALRRRGWPRLLLIFVAVYSLTVIVFFVFSRFRMVAIPALFVFGGLGAVELVRRWRAALSRQAGWPPALTAAGLFLVLLAFVNLPIRAKFESWPYRLATATGVPTRGETSALAHLNLGLAYAKRAKQESDPRRSLELAEAEIREALRQEPNPEHATKHVELGKILARQGRNREAIAVYGQAAAIEPRDYKIQHALGLLHRRFGELDAAEAAFRRALGLAPRHVASATRLGHVLLELNRPEEAAQAFRHALELSPGDRSAQGGLQEAQSR